MTVFRESRDYLSWGRAHRFAHHVARPAFRDEAPALMAALDGRSVLGHGMGRSYGDVALNRDQRLIDMRGLDRVIAFDRERGVIEVEAGVTLAALLGLLARPANGAGAWFLPVTPGTRHVSVGGAIANDVHGKNHHSAGCFGEHVLDLRLLRSDGTVRTCSPTENADLFRATIGGLGLTGLILSARIALKAAPGLWMEHEDIRYGGLDAFYDLVAESLDDWEHTVAWLDCLARGPQLGRGIFSRSRHVETPPSRRQSPPPALDGPPRLDMPADLPGFALNRLTVAAFNALYWRRAPERPVRRIVGHGPVFYPLDAIGRWNRLYGRRGFFQYQCAVPTAAAGDAIPALLTEIARSGEGSFLAVLKTLGDRPSPGMLSFPMPGVTLALDFPNNGPRTHDLLDRLDRITAEAGGRLYAAKDGRATFATFQRGYPQLETFVRHIDPRFSSSFWRRVGPAAREGA